MNEILKKFTSEPVGSIGLLIAIAAVIPAYLTLFKSQNYAFDFTCTEVTPDSEAVLIPGHGQYHDFIGIRTRCDFSNLDDQTISIKSFEATAIYEGYEDYTYVFETPYGEIPEDLGFDFPNDKAARAISAGEAYLFDEVFMVPVNNDWAESENCSEVSYYGSMPLWKASNCFRDVQRHCFKDYLDGMEFWGGAGGTKPYRALALRLKLGNNTYARASLELSWAYDLHDSPSLVPECPNPDKTLPVEGRELKLGD